MTTEIEEKFFKCFGISNCNNCEHKEEDYFSIDCCYLCEKYPEITAEKLLELICILNKYYADNFQVATLLVGDNIEKVRKCILNSCIEEDKFIKQAVRKLFEDER